jgi:hypothetical protein
MLKKIPPDAGFAHVHLIGQQDGLTSLTILGDDQSGRPQFFRRSHSPTGFASGHVTAVPSPLTNSSTHR